MAGKILTRAEYEVALDTHYERARQLADSRRRHLTKKIFIERALARWDKAALEYGPCDLTARDQLAESTDETIDEPAWLVIWFERKARGL